MTHDLIEFIENARHDANYQRDEGRDAEAVVTLSVEQCNELSVFFLKAYGAVLTGKRDEQIADKLALLAGAFAGED